jgi:osmotically-inducible protein OsmY
MLLGAVMGSAACAPTRTQQAPGEYVDDSVLTTKVKAALVDDPITKARQISVETYRGTVQLSGFVDNKEERATATKVARSVQGVTEVKNDLEIKQR